MQAPGGRPGARAAHAARPGRCRPGELLVTWLQRLLVPDERVEQS
ncbi:hypothetical protein ACIBCT_37625 [Streptosporangium sp. NPDC050855]